MDALRQDIVYALRVLRRDWAYSAAVILTLAICFGANTAIFTVVRSVLLRPLPYSESSRLVSSYESFPGAGVERAGTSVPNYVDTRSMTDVFSSVALYQRSGYKVDQGDRGEMVTGMNVTPSFFQVLAAGASHGRLFTEEDGTPGRNRVVVVSHAFAARQGSNVESVVGQQLRLNDQTYDIVGVLPDRLVFLSPEVRLYVPLAFTPEELGEDRRYSQNHQLVARLAPGVPLERARARVQAHDAAMIERAGPLKDVLVEAGFSTRMRFLEDDIVRNVRAALQMLWGGVVFVVLIAAVNVANVALVRSSGRIKELATRSGIGAGHGRIARQLITEATVLTLGGGVLGLLLGVLGLNAIEWIGFTDLPRAHEIRIDTAVLAVTLAPALLLAIVLGAGPALQLARLNLNDILRSEGRSGAAGHMRGYIRRSLVVTQIGLAFILVVGAGLLFASFQRLLAVDPGFVAAQVVTGRVNLVESRYPDDAALRSYVGRALERVRGLPGVQSAGVSSYLPFSRDESSTVIIPEGYAAKPGESLVSPNQLYVSPGYLETLRVPLRRGRFFTDSDTSEAARVVIVDEQLAARFWPNLDPINRRMYTPERPEDVSRPGPTVTWLRVVGVVAAVKLQGLEEGENARAGAFYLPYAQAPRRSVGWAIRSRGEIASTSAAVQRVLAEIDPEAPFADVSGMSERVERSLNPRRAPMLLSLGFGAVALMLASIGLYGVLAYHVSQRTREIGIRMALGGNPSGILRLFLSEAAVLVLLGLAGGVVGAIALRGAIAGQLYGVGALDPLVLTGAVMILALTSLVACLAPALRAVRVSPLIALSRH